MGAVLAAAAAPPANAAAGSIPAAPMPFGSSPEEEAW